MTSSVGAPPQPRPASAIATAISRLQEPDAFQKIGYYALMAYVFFYLSRALEVTGLGNLKITMVLNFVWLTMAVITGGLFHILSARSGALFVGFAFWTVACLPFSVWRGGSMDTVTVTFRSLLLMSSIIALSVNSKLILRMIYTIGLAMGAASLGSMVSGKISSRGRLALEAGTFADPNTYCMALLMGLPMLWLMARNAPHPAWKIVPLAFVPPVLYTAFRTGSRAGMLALAAMMIFYFIRASGAKKLQLLVLAVVGLAVLLGTSDRLLKRFAILPGVDAEVSSDDLDSIAAAGSADGRMFLFMRSLELTAYNPIVGVGPGMFAVAENADAADKNQKGNWHETHNSYTQVSSECGLPGFFLYVGGIITALRSVRRVARLRVPPGDKDAERLRQGGVYLEMSMVTLMIGMFFLSSAYTGLIFIMCALAVSLERAANNEYPLQAPRLAVGSPAVPAPPIPVLSRIR